VLILATISDPKRLAILVDLESGDQVAVIPTDPLFFDSSLSGRPHCRPFGITWDADELYVANNRQLLAFGPDLTLLRIFATCLQVNTHQLGFYDQRIWAVSPWTNSLVGVESHGGEDVELDLRGQQVRPYVYREANEEEDKAHFNSLLWSDGFLFVGAHCFGAKSFILQYEAENLRLVNVLSDVGSSLHGLARSQGHLYWISTRTSELKSDSGYSLQLRRAGYARGFAMTDRCYVVATSEFLARGERVFGDSWIDVIDRSDGKVVQEIRLADTGSVNDLRLVDVPDHAHGVAPFFR
jgi:hypothetical protein